MWATFGIRSRKGRPGKCHECHQPVLAGQKYAVLMFKAGAYTTRWVFHLACLSDYWNRRLEATDSETIT